MEGQDFQGHYGAISETWELRTLILRVHDDNHYSSPQRPVSRVGNEFQIMYDRAWSEKLLLAVLGLLVLAAVAQIALK